MGGLQDFEVDRLEKFYDSVLDGLNPGLNILLIHPAFDNYEMRGITQEKELFGSKWRETDYKYFTSSKCKSKIKANNILLIDWSDVRKTRLF